MIPQTFIELLLAFSVIGCKPIFKLSCYYNNIRNFKKLYQCAFVSIGASY